MNPPGFANYIHNKRGTTRSNGRGPRVFRPGLSIRAPAPDGRPKLHGRPYDWFLLLRQLPSRPRRGGPCGTDLPRPIPGSLVYWHDWSAT